MSEYKITVGIECHVQLNTKTKLFSAVDNDAVDKEPNSCVSPFDYALPGMLPVLNKEAVHKAVQAGLAMNCKIGQPQCPADSNRHWSSAGLYPWSCHCHQRRLRFLHRPLHRRC